MSINVNVSGNPVSIKGGKLVTADLDYSDGEFQKRRRIRLEQVRQQSKNIAEEVRNKVREKKSQQLSDIEKQGERELKKWQTQKLLALQQQYRECLKDIGLGHAQAILEEESDVEYERQNEDYKQIAKERGDEAVKKVTEKKILQSLDKTEAVQKKTLNKCIESTRSKMVANLNNNNSKKTKSPFKKKKHGKITTDINISTRRDNTSEGNETENDSEIEYAPVLHISSPSSVSSHGETDHQFKKTVKSPTSTVPSISSKDRRKNLEVEERSKVPSFVNEIPGLYTTNTEIPGKTFDYYLSTQISDRIKNRPTFKHFEPSNSNVCDVKVPIKYSSCCCGGCHHTSAAHKFDNVLEANNSECKTEIGSKQIESEESKIPAKPAIALKAVPSSTVSSNLNKVQYCDYKNHYNKEYIPNRPTIERISEECIELCGTPRSEVEYMERMYKRDQDAQIRGKKALEKEKVHRDYKEIMQQLPALQRQERIASISSNKPSFHMSNDRLKENEKKHQNRMENAYEKLLPKPQIITIPPRDLPKDNNSALPFKTISVNAMNPPVINVGSWDFDVNYKSQPHINPKQISSEFIQETLDKVDSEQQKSVLKRQEQLQEMQKTLKDKREQLAKEIDLLPESSKLRAMLDDVGGLDEFLKLDNDQRAEPTRLGVFDQFPQTENGKKVDKGTETTNLDDWNRRRKNTRRSKVSSSSTSPKNTTPTEGNDNQRLLINNKDEQSKYHCLCTVDSSSNSQEKYKKPKVKSKSSRYRKSSPIILQNTSTQTSICKESKPISEPKENEPASAEVLLPNKYTEDESPKLSVNLKQVDTAEPDTMCPILIKIDDEGKPQICLAPSKLKDKEIIVKTGIIKSSPAQEKKQVKPAKEDTRKSTSLKHKSKQKIDTSKKEQTASKTKACSNNKNCMTWKDRLSQNSPNTSTSYYSPPDLAASLITALGKKQSGLGALPHHLAGILRDRPQQQNIPNSVNTSSEASSKTKNSKDPEVCPLKCIKKLLTMSRQSIEDLQVSTVSDVSTPGTSIIQMKSNIPTDKNSDTLKDLFSTPANSTTLSSRNLSTPANDQNPCTKDMTLDEYCQSNYPGVMEIYNKLTENCSKKIEYLASLLEKNRAEKLNLISPSGGSSDKEASTKYLELPKELRKQAKTEINNPNTKDKSSSSADDELNQQLLEIDYKLVERLKYLSPAEIQEQFPLPNLSVSDPTSEDSADHSLAQRFRNLVQSHSTQINSTDVQFPPLLIDIPNLPRLEAKPLGPSLKANGRSKPPPSKGLTTVRRFNDDIITAPHQLSTIVESDSKLQSTGTQQDLKTIHLVGPAKEQQVSSESNKASSTSDSLPDIITEVVRDITNRGEHTGDSDSSNNEQESIVKMLKSLGMGSWAVSTVRKTQEALAIPSSSSSMNNDSKHKLTDSSSTSTDALLRESGRSSKPDESHGSSQFIRELQGMSVFDKTNQRTSTPIQSNRSDNSKSTNISGGEVDVVINTCPCKDSKSGSS